MFLTLTIDTHQKKKPMLRLQTKRISPTNGWQRALNVKKRGLWQRMKTWNRDLRGHESYKLRGQVAML